jgi:pimeloyl-ACP methyl ester carboxylesterase
VANERLVLFPGMGADGRLFEPQARAGIQFEAAELITPLRSETLADYAARMRDAVDLAGPCVVGGVSFGGMLACEVARICGARCVVLIASCRNRAGIPSHYRMVEWMSRLVPDVLIQRRAAVSGRLLAALECIDEREQQLVMQMSREVAVPQLRRIARMILQWQTPARLPCPVYHIHGDADRIIPIRRVTPDEVVHSGGHLINLTHAEQVNSFITRCLEQVRSTTPPHVFS